MNKENKSDKAKLALLEQQQREDRARKDAEEARAREAQGAYAAQQAQYGGVLERESAADRALQERLMGQQFEQAGQDRGVFQSAMDRYLDQQQAASEEQKRLTDLGLGQQATDRATYDQLMRQSQVESPLEQQYGGGMTDWFKFMNGGQGQPAPIDGGMERMPRIVDSGGPRKGEPGWVEGPTAMQRMGEGVFHKGGEQMAQGRPVSGLPGDGASPYQRAEVAPMNQTATQPNARYRDYTNAPGLIHSGLFESAQKRREDERTALGARQFGAQGANANLLGLQKQSMADQASQRFGAAGAKAVTDRDAEMRASVLPFLNYQAGNRQGLLNTAAGLAENRLSGLTGLAAGGANNLGGIVGQLGSMAQGGQQNLTNMAQGGARGGLSQLYGQTSGAAQGLGGQLLSGANNNAQNSTNQFTNFQVRQQPSFLGQLLGPALQIGTGLATGGMSGLMGGGSGGVLNTRAMVNNLR